MNIVSEDKKLVLSVPLQTEISYIISKGRIFQHTKTSGRWERYKLPFTVSDAISPKTVSEIIKWAVYGTNAKFLNCNIRYIPV